jgi:hypothetical protein
MKLLYKRRLLKLSEHLERVKVGSRKRHMYYWHRECPIAFPKHWGFFGSHPVLRSEDESDYKGSYMFDVVWVHLMIFFGMTRREIWELFMPARAYSNSHQAKRIRRFANA